MYKKVDSKKLYELHLQGKTTKELADIFDVEPATISRKLEPMNTAIEVFGNTQGLERRELNILVGQKKNTKLRQLANKVANEISLLELVKENINVDDFFVRQPKKQTTTYNSTKVITISDTHFEDKETSKELYKLPDKVLKQVGNSKFVTLLLGGDFIEASKHADQIAKGVTEVEQTIEIAKILLNTIRTLRQNGIGVEVKIVAGNHDRVARNKFERQREETYAYIIAEMIKTTFEDMKVDYSPDYVEFKLPNGELAMMIHGDQINGGAKNVDKWLVEHNNSFREGKEPIKTIFVGHYHKYSTSINKGTRDNVILMPSTKPHTHTNRFEIENNLKSICGFLVIEYDNDGNQMIKFVKDK